jgi:methionyl-tRNA formyltransferase
VGSPRRDGRPPGGFSRGPFAVYSWRVPEQLRIVLCSAFVGGYRLVDEWVQRHGHEIVMLITLPGTRGLYGGGQEDLLDLVGDQRDVLVTKRLRGTAAPVMAALEPDLLVSAAFPRRIPVEMTSIPRLGAVNLHPAPLPRGRGPNPQRMVYEGEPVIGAALHRTTEEFDAGAILSRREEPLPDAGRLTPESIFEIWRRLLAEVIEEGTARVLAGELGDAQDEALASYAGPFTDDECWLDWHEPAATLQRRYAALNLMSPKARVRIDGEPFQVLQLRASSGVDHASPGAVLDRSGDMMVIRAGDGAVEVRVQPLGDK